MTTPIITFRERPCMPSVAASLLAQEDCYSVKAECANGILLEWYKDGTVHETLPQGDKTIFPSKPTHASFLFGAQRFPVFYLGYMTFQENTTGNYFEFNSNGSIVYRHNRTTFLWSPEFPAKAVEGVVRCSVSMYDSVHDDSMYERRDSYS